jgi:AP-2 complex subunit mu-1
VINAKETDAAALAPVRQFGDNSFLHLRAGNVYLLAITHANSNAMLVFSFLSRTVDLIKSYCNNDFSEEVVKGNFVLIYELLDEILDFGYPQVTDPSVMKGFIFQKGYASEATKKKREIEAQNATLQVCFCACGVGRGQNLCGVRRVSSAACRHASNALPVALSFWAVGGP